MFFRDRRSDGAGPEGGEGGYPMMPLKEVVVLPHVNLSLLVGRPRSVAAVHEANRRNGELLLVTQRAGDRDEPGPDDLYDFGTIAHIEQTLHLPDGNMKVVVAGRRRARITAWNRSDPFFDVTVEEFGPPELTREVQHLVRTVKTTFETYQKHNRDVPAEMVLAVNAMEDPDQLADTLIDNLPNLKVAERQHLLETVDVAQRLERVYKALLTEIEFLQVERKLKRRIKKEAEHHERESQLHHQMKEIQRELGDREGRGEVEELAQALAEKALPEAVRSRAEKELRKLAQMNGMSAEATVVRNYLDCILDLPWGETSGAVPDLSQAEDVLDEDHYGLTRIKERILEYLAVESLVDKMRGPILCLVGPPGVGKTSLARSIARATGRPFVRISLGGVRDEAEIRGHRRTYIGAMPGKILHAMRRAGTADPVLLLDEVDKMSSDFRGDPAAALLEVLDPEQNEAFGDHYLDLDYDLSKVTFICTANTLQGIPLPLQDRLEIIRLTGYTDREKLQIARRYLLPKQLGLHGLTEDDLVVSDKALLELVHGWTREAGVRELERKVAKICRRVARRVVREGRDAGVAKVTTANLARILGPPEHEVNRKEEADEVGLVKGLSVSQVGGSVLDIEVAAVPGSGKLRVTGRPGEVMKESSSAVFTYVRARAEALRLDPDFHDKHDFHIHYPGLPGGVEGPSAGIAMATAMVSALTGLPVRHDTAMTGEVSLRGRVLKIGGLKEKLLAAHRAGIRRVLIPEPNVKDLEDLPAYVLEALEVLPVEHMDRVLKEALAIEGARQLFGSLGATPEEPLRESSATSGV
jgi:ATP-dependent Lon protease